MVPRAGSDGKRLMSMRHCRLVVLVAAAAAAHAAANLSPQAAAAPPPIVPGCPTFHILHDVGLSHGAGNVTKGVQSASACCALCAHSPKCEAWSWHPAGTHVRSCPTRWPRGSLASCAPNSGHC